MSDDLRDKFSNDDEFDEFKNSFSDYKNKEGMFESPSGGIMKIQELIMHNFVNRERKYFKVPDDIFGVKNMSLYMFHCENSMEFDSILSIFLN